ncbi:MAG: OB-fold nucleic acid binding domain-containing protein, partial [Candidatus Izemoplasmatales bacterium]
QEEFLFLPFEEYSFEELKQAEKELIGFHFRYHPLSPYLTQIEAKKWYLPSDLDQASSPFVQIAASVTRIKTITTKQGDEMAFLTLEDMYSQVDSILFPKDYLKYQQMIVKEGLYVIRGKIEERNDRLQVVIQDMTPLERSLST